MEYFVGHPTINKNIAVKGSFEQRNEIQKKKKEESKQRILAESMGDSTFEPKTNSPKRYKNIGSKIKSIWKSEESEYSSS